MRRTVYGLMGTGLHGTNGVGPATSAGIFRCYVLSRFLYGLDVADLNKTQTSAIRSQHLSLIRRFQSLPGRTATAAVYLLFGTMPIDGEIDIQKLGLLGQMSRSGNRAIQDIALFQYATKPMDSGSWFAEVAKLLLVYELPTMETVLENPASKFSWKRQVKAAVHEHWTKLLQKECTTKSTLKFLNTRRTKVGVVHHIWRFLEPCVKDVRRAYTKAKLLTGTYPTQERLFRWSDGRYPAMCPLCMTAIETVPHFLIECPALHSVRARQLSQIAAVVKPKLGTEIWTAISEDPEALSMLVLDCTWFVDAGMLMDKEDTISTLEYHSRRLCHDLHCTRAHLLLESVVVPRGVA
jgi:hypothetical protein